MQYIPFLYQRTLHEFHEDSNIIRWSNYTSVIKLLEINTIVIFSNFKPGIHIEIHYFRYHVPTKISKLIFWKIKSIRNIFMDVM